MGKTWGEEEVKAKDAEGTKEAGEAEGGGWRQAVRGCGKGAGESGRLREKILEAAMTLPR